jgi:hypothetical protein
MARDKELMGLGLPAFQAVALGFGPGATSLTGAGTSSQADALALVQGVNVFSTVAANSGGRLPVAGASGPIAVCNAGANALLVYPATGQNINGGSANGSFSVTNAKSALFLPYETGWVAILSA